MSSFVNNSRLETVWSDSDEHSVYTGSPSDASYDADNPGSDIGNDFDAPLPTQPPVPLPVPVPVPINRSAVVTAAAIQQSDSPGSVISQSASMESYIKAKEAADSARSRKIIIVAVVTTVVVLGVTLGVVFGYDKDSGSDKPSWAEDSRYEYCSRSPGFLHGTARDNTFVLSPSHFCTDSFLFLEN